MSRGAYYNECDPHAARWLRNLIAAGLIAPGDVDDRRIQDVRAADIAGYSQCHFFAGIAGWSLALRRAFWPDDQPVWTGSCPCQPLSVAGQGKGDADERHLWPAFFTLIAQCRPAIVFGEQVASRDGREWLAGIRADLEGVGYACGAADLCAAGVGAPHIRQRLYWLAHGGGGRLQAWGHACPEFKAPAAHAVDASGCGVEGLDDADGRDAKDRSLQRGGQHGQQPSHGERLAWMGDAEGARPQGQWREYRPRGERHRGLAGLAMQDGVPGWNGPAIAIECADGARRVSAQPCAFPLAHGVPGRMGRLRAYGNAIVPDLAARFIVAARLALDDVACGERARVAP